MISTQYWSNIQHIAEDGKWAEQMTAKTQIIKKLFENLNIVPDTILFPAFNPVVLQLEMEYNCIVVADKSLKAQWHSESKFVDSLDDIQGHADVCLALDEYFTHAETEQDQRDLIDAIGKVTRGHLITTLQDYKNAAPHKKSQVDASVSGATTDIIIVEQNILDKNNRQNWQNYIYMIEDHEQLTVLGPNLRRTMYFKQLAKYTSDIAGTEYVIQKNLLYRGFFKKHYEHMITVRFP